MSRNKNETTLILEKIKTNTNNEDIRTMCAHLLLVDEFNSIDINQLICKLYDSYEYDEDAAYFKEFVRLAFWQGTSHNTIAKLRKRLLFS